MHIVEFSISGAKRRRSMPTLPRVGDVVDLDDQEDGRLVVSIKSMVHFEERSEWTFICECTPMKNWLEPQW
jgi:hypothetical protein